jgi:predicted RecB family endonuclease
MKWDMYVIELEDGGTGLVTIEQGHTDPLIEGMEPVLTVEAADEDEAERKVAAEFEARGYGRLGFETIEQR